MHKTDKAVSPKDVSVYIFTKIMNIIFSWCTPWQTRTMPCQHRCNVDTALRESTVVNETLFQRCTSGENILFFYKLIQGGISICCTYQRTSEDSNNGTKPRRNITEQQTQFDVIKKEIVQDVQRTVIFFLYNSFSLQNYLF